MIIGLCGTYCAGKNAVSEVFEKNGYYTIDVDKTGHSALEEKASEIASQFPDCMVDGKVDRKKLGSIVFSDRESLEKLESIIHPAMAQTVRNQIQGKSKVLINAAVLVKMGLHRSCHGIVWLDAPFFTRLGRSKERDGKTFSQFLQVFWSQRSLKSQTFRETADIQRVELVNNGSLQKLESEILKLPWFQAEGKDV
jgi:dephospho-CoA kinase